MSGPLSHVRVLDLSRIMAGPWATQMLADLGADVIKVERPGSGDDTRGWGPPFLKARDGTATTDSGYFLAVNRGKRSICLDLGNADDRNTIMTLVAQADVLVENYKVGTLARFGLDYAALQAINPRLVYASVTGFGQTGPRASQAAYDFMIQAMGGLMSVTGQADGNAGGGPQKVGVPIVDLMTGMYTAVAVLAALARRNETGRGDYIDIAMLDVQTAFLANQAMNYLLSGQPPQRNGNTHPNIQPQDVYRCQDGYAALAVGNDEQFARFAAVLAQPQWAHDPRFARNAQRVRNLPALQAQIAAVLAQRTVSEWVSLLDAVGVPCAPINSIPQVFADAQVVHRQLLRELPHALAGTAPSVVSPMRFANAPLDYQRGAPTLDEHRAEILSELGITTSRLQN